MPVIYTLIDDGIPVRDIAALRVGGGTKRVGKSSIMEWGAPVCSSGTGQS